MFQPGSVRRIQVKNFVTYTHAEFYPVPHLNIIIGPNGTGKSTMVAAIILGLGGNPKTVGRGSKIKEYVKHGCNEAEITIHLQGNDDNTFLKVTRQFDVRDKNVWFINNTKKSVAEVLDVIKIYNIQVDNLCQFLPQDRVQDFAKMNKQELLKATQLALCREDLVEKQQKLIDFKTQYAQIHACMEKNEQKLIQAKETNSRSEIRVESFNKKKKFLENIQNIDRKVAWIQFERLREELDEIKNDMHKAKEVYEREKKKGKPMEEELNNARRIAKGLECSHSETMKMKWDMTKRLETKYEKQDAFKHEIQKVIQNMNIKLDEISQKDAEIISTMKMIEELESIQKKWMEKYKNDQQVNQEIRQITTEIHTKTTTRRSLEDKRDNLISTKVNNQAELRMLENEVIQLENVKNKRLQKLYQIDKGVHQAVLWLRNNKHLFKGEVCEPMMLEINVLDTKDAIFLENIISKRDNLAFTCERKDDMNLLIQILRKQQKLPVNVLHSNTNIDMEQYKPTIPIEHLRKFGFHAYVDHLLNAPPLIIHYLYKNYGIHNIPVGNARVEQYFEQMPNSLKIFFSDKCRYSVKFSNYTGEKSISQNQIRPNNILSISVDTEKLENLKGQIHEKKESVAIIENELKNCDNQLEQCRKRIEELQVEYKQINDSKQQIQVAGARYMAMKKKLATLKEVNSSKEDVKQEADQEIRTVVKGMVAHQKEISSAFESYRMVLSKSQLSMIKLESARRKTTFLENEFQDIMKHCKEAEQVLNIIKEKYSNIVGQTKVALQKAKQLSNGFTPDDEGFDEFKDSYKKLPDDLKALQSEKNQILLKIDCLKIADDDELVEYERREELIRNLRTEIDKTNIELTKMKSQMEKLEEDWLNPLADLVKEINSNFSDVFKRMKCSAEVAIWTGEDALDYSKYGLSIKVSFRNDEPLQELNSTTQSGGERAVATAAFMLSLQELTPVPFRCVDEINQGMDNNNERRIFDLLLECTTRPNTSQYFLITPKLVPNLKYSKNMAIHIVHNGPFINSDRKWFMSKLCNPQGVTVNI